MKRLLLVATVLFSAPTLAESPAVSQLLSDYRAAGAGAFNADEGKALWAKEVVRDGEKRRCASCHTDDLRAAGKHANTGKAIEPLAPSVNAKRLTDVAEIEKWFGRNCKWTYGRACTPQEKGHLLAYIQTQ